MIGTQKTLNYPPEFVTLPEYTARAGQKVTVVRELRDGDEYDREDGDRMYEVQAADGWIGHAYESELVEEWSGSPCPLDPDNFWVDDDTGERVNVDTGERAQYTAEQLARLAAMDQGA